MQSLYGPLLILHILAACLWVGSQLFLSLVVVPYLRRTTPYRERIELLSHLGEAFALPSWITFGVFFVTGLGLIGLRHTVPGGMTSAFWMPFGIKFVLVLIIMLHNYLHIHRLGPKMRDAVAAMPPDGDPTTETEALRRRLTRVSMANGLLSVIVVGLGVYLP